MGVNKSFKFFLTSFADIVIQLLENLINKPF